MPRHFVPARTGAHGITSQNVSSTTKASKAMTNAHSNVRSFNRLMAVLIIYHAKFPKPQASHHTRK